MNGPYIVDLPRLSDTMPEVPEHYIPRDNYVETIERDLESKDVFFLDALEGTGVTTTLALFAHTHRHNCITYFNNEMVKQLLDPAFIEQSLIRQLYFFINGIELTDEEVSSLSLSTLYIHLRRKLRNTNQRLYFVFDGFDNIPAESKENIKMVFDKLPWDMGKFVFSGKYENLKEFLPRKIKCVPDLTLQRFARIEVVTFLKHIDEALSGEELEALCKISDCMGSQLREIVTIYERNHSFEPVLQMDDVQAGNLFAYHFSAIEHDENTEDAQKLLALVAFIHIRLTKTDIALILSMDSEHIDAALNTCENYLVCRDGYIVFNTEYNQRYIQNRLSKLRSNIELLFIQQFGNKTDNPEATSYMPVLYKERKDKKGLVRYLNSDVVMRSIEQKQSQSALNEQCELGFSSISLDDAAQAASMFRFALNKSASREIEQNELWDNQIEALLAVGMFDSAYSLAMAVYLKEERLKALLLIARKKNSIPSSIMDEVRIQISHLVDEIDFEHIPDKSMELAKLMFPYDYKVAVDIIERIAKVSKSRFPIDRLYTLLSISSGHEKEKDSSDKFDVITSKIENDQLKTMTRAAHSIFSKSNVDEILTEVRALPSVQQGLLLLQYWIPEHASQKDIGKLVIYAVQSVISISNMERPKVAVIRDFCTPLPKMTPAEINQVIVMLDSFQSTLLTPAEDYVRLELKVVEALFTFSSERACERIQNLYLKVDDFNNKSTVVACKSIILGQYDRLGDKKALEDALMPSYKLQSEIEKEIKDLFSKTAYHLKIVEEPLKSLVVGYRSSVEAIIRGVNTRDRRCRSYMIAAEAYVHQVKPMKWDWDYLSDLISKITYDTDERSQLLYTISAEIVHTRDADADFLEKIKKHHQLFYNVEQAFSKCSVLANLYVLFKQVTPDDSFTSSLASELGACWEKVDSRWVKVDLGFLIAKILARVSVDEAKEWIQRVSSIQQNSIIASSSSVAAFEESFDLYNRSLGMLIRSDLVNDKILSDYTSILDELESKGTAIISWSKTALYYYLKDNEKKFEEVYTRHIAKSLDSYSNYYKKYVFFHSAPAFYLGSRSYFYTVLDALDDSFKDLCISRVAKFIFVKYVELGDADPFRGAYELKNKDFENLLDLLEHCVDDSNFFAIFDSACQSLVKSHRDVSSDQRQHFINKFSELIETHLPMKGGIQHDGYKVACQISLSRLLNVPQNQTLFDKWESQIDGIKNTADQVFLAVHAAHYINKTEKRQYFINKASTLIKEIPSTFDQSSRLDYCIDECKSTTNGLTKNMIWQFIETMCSDKNGKIGDVKRAYDSIYEYDESLADTFLERMDTDPARNYYKAQLAIHSQKTKKIASVRYEHSKVSTLSNHEQKAFFSRQIANQISNKATIYNVADTMEILPIIYRNTISDVRGALSYFLENVYRKHQQSGNQAHLLKALHEAILFNLKLVMALSSGTMDKLRRINQIIGEPVTSSSPSFMAAGERDKAINYIIKWYTKHPYDNLFIIDAYFSPADFQIVKTLMNINNNLSVTIITHRKNVVEMEEYQAGWDKVSSDLTGSIEVHTVCYESNRSDGPLHARWWLSIDEDEDLRVGIKLTSVSNLGKKDEDISEIEEEKISDIERLAMNYALGKRKRVDDQVLKYESCVLK